MTDWIAAARLENQKKADRPTAKTAKTPVKEVQSEVSSVLAVPHLPVSGKSGPTLELLRLVGAVAAFYGFNSEERRQAWSLATASPNEALASYRDIATRNGIRIPFDERVTCAECRRLVNGRCQAARMGLMQDTQTDYSPVADVPRNCEFFSLRSEL